MAVGWQAEVAGPAHRRWAAGQPPKIGNIVAMQALWHRLWQRFWMLPALCCVVAFALGAILPDLDDAFVSGNVLVFGGGPDGARSLLSAIVTSMISVTGLVFSITVMSLQLASSQFSPRVLRTFLDSRITQLTLGLFAGTFLRPGGPPVSAGRLRRPGVRPAAGGHRGVRACGRQRQLSHGRPLPGSTRQHAASSAAPVDRWAPAERTLLTGQTPRD